MPNIQILNPDVLGKPLGQYSHITRVKASEFLFIAGQVGVDKDGTLAGDFDAHMGGGRALGHFDDLALEAVACADFHRVLLCWCVDGAP